MDSLRGLPDYNGKYVEIFLTTHDQLIMRDIVLVNPPVSMEERYGDFASSGNQIAPLGLCYIAAVLRDSGFQVRIIDSSALNLDFQSTIQQIIESDPAWVGITASVVAISKASMLASMIKKETSRLKVVIGGPQVTAEPYKTMEENLNFDIGVMGEGEITVRELAFALDKGSGLENIKGLLLRRKGSVFYSGSRDFIQDLDTLPFPTWDLLPDIRNNYQPAVFTSRRFPAFSIITSRGCPSMCTFCDKAVFGSKFRAHSAEYCIEMIEKLKLEYGIKEFVISDDNFVVFKSRLRAICDTLIKKKTNISWSCNARVDQVDYETLKLMKRSGCWHMGFGIESGSLKVLNEIKKKTNPKQIREVLELCSKAGIMSKGYFLIGAPLEDKVSVMETINFAKSLPLSDFQLSYFTPLPGSEVYNNYEKYGTLESNFDLMNYFEPTFIPFGMSKEEIIYYYRLAYREFYLRPRVIFSYLLRIRSIKYAKQLFLAGWNVVKISLKGLLQREYG